MLTTHRLFVPTKTNPLLSLLKKLRVIKEGKSLRMQLREPIILPKEAPFLQKETTLVRWLLVPMNTLS